MKMPVVSASWKASVPIRCDGTWPVTITSGVESRNASATGVTRFVAPGPGGRHGDADLARRARVALRHVAGALLVAHEHVLDLRSRRGERVVDRKDRPAGDPEADLDAARLERADNGLRAGEALAFVGIGRGCLGGGGPLFCGGHRSLPVVGQWAVGWGMERAVGDLGGDLVGGRACRRGRACGRRRRARR